MNVSCDFAFTERLSGSTAMVIEELPRPNCVDFLRQVRFGRLACAQADQPYVTPCFFAYHQDALYSFSTVGQKVAWMRENPLVCVEADQVSNPQQWISVVVFGRYEELPSVPEYESDRNLAYRLLSERPVWWEPGYARTEFPTNQRVSDLVYFRIHIARITGHRARS